MNPLVNLRNESVGELACRIDKKESGADKTQLAGCHDSAVDYRLLDNAQAHTADIIHAVCRHHGPECFVSQCLIP